MTETAEKRAPSPKPRKRNPEQSRRRILDSAERAFASRGYDGARLRDIAQEAQVHHALVHHYYGDKKGLFNEVIRRGLGRISAPGIETLSEGSGLERKLTLFVSMVFDFYANNEQLLRIMDSAFRDPESVAFKVTQESLGKLASPLLDTVKHRIQRAVNRGSVRDDIPIESLILYGFSTIAYRFLAGQGFVEMLGMGDQSERDLEREKDFVVKYILAAMRPATAPVAD